MTEQNMYDAGLGKTPANFGGADPLSFWGGPPGLSRLSGADPRHPAPELAPDRAYAAASSLRPCAVAALARGTQSPSSPPMCRAMFEAHFGVPTSGAVLNTINTRLDADAMAFIFQHAQSKVVLVDRGVRRRGAKGALSLTASPW